jgi:4-carboxymuconolactone decarboxylase
VQSAKNEFKEKAMARLPPIPRDEMTELQGRLHDRIAAQRTGGQVGGPFAVMLHAPNICDPVSQFIDQLMSDSPLPHKLKEVTILTIAQAYQAPYEWVVHERRARRFGLEDAVIESLKTGQVPNFSDNTEKLIYGITKEMLDQRRLSDTLYKQAEAALGKEPLVEFIILLGFYISVAVLLVSFDVEGPGGENPFTS